MVPASDQPAGAGARASAGPVAGRWRTQPAVRWLGLHPLTWLTAVAVVLALARVQLGVDMSDGMHAVELTRRLAMGDRPFVDEMNLQVLGAWPAVPFVWAWLQLVGTDGLVLVARVVYVVIALIVAHVCWRATAPHLGGGVAAAAIAVAIVPSAYNLPVISYNTTPALLLLLAASAALAATARRSAGWGAVVGACIALTPVSHVAAAPAAAVLGLLALIWCGERRVRLAMIGGGAVAALIAGIALAFWWGGPSALEATLSYTNEYQGLRVPFRRRLIRAVSYYVDVLSSPLVLGAAALALVAGLLRGRRAWLLLAGSVVLVGVAMIGGGEERTRFTTYAWLSGVTGTVLLGVLTVPAIVGLARRGWLAGPVGRYVATGIAASVVGVSFVAALTTSTAAWGATAAVTSPGLAAVTVGLLRPLRRGGRVPVAVVGGLLVAVLASSHAMTSFRSPPLSEMSARVSIGANAGLWTSKESVDQTERDTRFAQVCAGQTALTIGLPGAMLLADARPATPIVWLGSFGQANRTVVGWLEDRNLRPQCIFTTPAFWPVSPARRERDPLLSWLGSNYRLEDRQAWVLLRPR